MKTELKIKVTLQILKPASEVFEAIVDPAKMSNYFIAKGSGRMEEGSTVMWSFPEPAFAAEFPVKVLKVENGKFVAFNWDAANDKNLVEITLVPHGENTVVTVTEAGGNVGVDDTKWLVGNTEGWAYFLSALKAYVEYGINLRKGAFDFPRDTLT